MLLISSSSSSRRFPVSVTSKIINSAKVFAGVEMRNSICIITTRTSTSTGAPTDIKSPLVNLKVARLVSLDARNEVVVGGGRSKMKLRAVARDYWKLSKGGLSVYAALSALPGYLVSCGLLTGAIGSVVLNSTGVFMGTLLCAASSQAVNQIMEKERDGNMTRTKSRPLPTGRITTFEAGVFAALTCGVGNGILYSVGGAVPVIVALSTAALYTMVYTPMKTKSPYNTHIGSIAGSLPVLIGFSVAGVPLFADFAPWMLFMLQTLWQFPHFYALAWLYRSDYSAAGYKMFPLDDDTGRKTAAMCWPYMVGLAVLPVVASGLGVTSWMFAFSAMVVTAEGGDVVLEYLCCCV
ncbi:conserved hypothetical protein [Perkinsus marinus ATCC 50983]|uniref:Heme O synthase n=1 Tax=Perkinsus marinus (strain ATCC 50983 / TXsc) TaxID=423536 RepID=C5LWJ8_PERM5|nr:conserved hypothetical protein [Perkinsus marinus ATCC 50983]EEQ98911.1 conserved hypothetical protein [Perkinsus marinus ATCC 50983]|eukprot:XP_002766194.1 conserved hypothetical protein [Perkinsus marinus ATCC 50983]